MKYFSDSPVIAIRDMPREASALSRLRKKGLVWSPLPGVYAHRDTPDSWELRIQAAHLWAPEAVVCGAAAARLLWWPNLQGEKVALSGGSRDRPAPWVSISRAVIDPDLYLMLGHMKVARPALSTLQLAADIGGTAIDEVLRRGAATMPQLRETLNSMPRFRGIREVRRLVHQSKDEPWSALERQAHQMLHRANIKRWKGNYEIWLDGRRFFIDIAFVGAKIAIEIDGFEFHSSREAFDRDREKRNLLVLDGWIVLNYTWNTIDDLVPQLARLLRLQEIAS